MTEHRLDPVSFEIIKNALVSVAEEMGMVLRRSSFSANIKERRDFSCALFDQNGRLAAQAEHIPVHLGAMPYSVKAVLEKFQDDLAEDDTVILNDPYRGGTHLPDITMVSPIFHRDEIIGFAANRAHHSDVGGTTPGSMSPLSTDIEQEGLRIPPVKLVAGGTTSEEVMDLILSNVRTPRERQGDLRAQQAANNVGSKRFVELARKLGLAKVLLGMKQLQEYSRELMVREIRKLPQRSVRAVDYLDNDGFDDKPIPIRVMLRVTPGKLAFDFTGSSSQVKGPLNAVFSITLSAVYYVTRCVTDPSIPANAGCFEPVEVIAPEGTIVNAQPPAAVAGGNVETSTRIVDVVLRAFARIIPERVCAACQGTMNNITIGGMDNYRNRYFTYYETIAGGFGARYNKDGVDGVHSHLTNTLNTPIEALESSFPFLVRQYELIRGSGGRGKFRGGLGVRREMQLLSNEATISMMGDRQAQGPWGLRGGQAGNPGKYLLYTQHGKVRRLASKSTFTSVHGDVLSIYTPGGGGYGKSEKRQRQLSRADIFDDKM